MGKLELGFFVIFYKLFTGDRSLIFGFKSYILLSEMLLGLVLYLVKTRTNIFYYSLLVRYFT